MSFCELILFFLYFKVFLEVTQGILEHGGRVGSKLEAKEDQQNKEAIDMLSRLEVPST